MNLEVSFWIFVILTIMHPIGDFMTPIRQFGKGWKQFFVSEWFLVLNPMHFVWDKWSPYRRHHLYLKPVDYLGKIGAKQLGVNLPDDYTFIGRRAISQPNGILITDNIFWRWLAIDQLYHMISNVFLALLIGGIV